MSAVKHYIYILQLENDKWYVGQTKNPQSRIQSHIDGKGSTWTKLHNVVDIYDVKQMKLGQLPGERSAFKICQILHMPD